MAALETLVRTARGIRTHVLHGGDPDSREAVVLVHGNPGSSQDWAPLMQALAPFARVIAPDMPGFGHADKPADFPYSVEAGAAFLGELLQQMNVARAHLVLHDFGGPWGLQWAIDHPEAFASVTLINTGLLKNYRWHLMARIWRTPILGELAQWSLTRSGFRLALSVGCPQGLPLDFVNRMYDDLDRGTRRAILKLYRATDDLSARSESGSASLRAMPRPALVIWGTADPYLPQHHALQQRDTFPDAEVLLLPRSGHFPFADDPEAVEAAAVPFLQRHWGRLADPA
jgi:pimeloyl-ACP methyl ester carboxylesterase